MRLLELKKGAVNRYATLLVRDVPSCQIAHLKHRFELAPASLLAEKVCALTNEAIAAWEKDQGITRVRPGEVVFTFAGQPVKLPLLPPAALEHLAHGVSVRAVRREIENEAFLALKTAKPHASFEDLWRLLDQGELVSRRRGQEEDFLPEAPLDVQTLAVKHRRFTALEAFPRAALAPAIQALEKEWNVRPGQAEAMVTLASQLYAWCSPRVEELSFGQVVWLARGTRKSRHTDPRLFSPVVLTLLTPEEAEFPCQSRTAFKALKVRQLERITAEAWQQDAVLTTLDLEWLLSLQPGLIRELLEAYHERFGVLLPTAGTVLDMGRTLTHKAIVVEMALSGLTTQEIARRIYHTPEAVDSYLRLFERVLLLTYYQVPEAAMPRITGHSPGLLEEHLNLVRKHFPSREAIAAYLNQHGVKVQMGS